MVPFSPINTGTTCVSTFHIRCIIIIIIIIISNSQLISYIFTFI
jgi:hypothetical protein